MKCDQSDGPFPQDQGGSTMSNDEHSRELFGGDVRIWINEGGAISLIACDKHGDPVELAEHEVQKLIDALRGLLEEAVARP
jgi:hypothetical protein